MSNVLLDQAIKLLTLDSIYIRESSVKTGESFEPAAAFDAERAFVVQVYSGVSAITEKMLGDSTDSDPDSTRVAIAIQSGRKASEADIQDDSILWKYDFDFTAAIRAIQGGEEITSQEVPDERILIEIKATLRIAYLSSEEISQDVLGEFGSRNVPHNAWPFWREFVHNSCSRSGWCPPLVVPLLKPAPKQIVLNPKNLNS